MSINCKRLLHKLRSYCSLHKQEACLGIKSLSTWASQSPELRCRPVPNPATVTGLHNHLQVLSKNIEQHRAHHENTASIFWPTTEQMQEGCPIFLLNTLDNSVSISFFASRCAVQWLVCSCSIRRYWWAWEDGYPALYFHAPLQNIWPDPHCHLEDQGTLQWDNSFQVH